MDDLRKSEHRIFSQNGEDGILSYIFSKIGTTNKYFVEFGCAKGRACNTRNLVEGSGWHGLMMDGNADYIESAKAFYKTNKVIDRVQFASHIVTAENIEKILAENTVPNEIDLLSIDIDGNDYWVWKAIHTVSPRIIVIEYNASIDPMWTVTVKYDPEFNRFKKASVLYHGASLSALAELAKVKGYYLIGCDSWGVNAFFIRNDVGIGKIKSASVKQAFYPHKKRLTRMTLAQQFEHTKTLDFQEI